MAWNDKVLDNLEQLYWSPSKLGLQSIKLQPAAIEPGYLVPADLVSGGRSVYCRRAKSSDWKSSIVQDEEILNQVLEIAFAIAPSSFLEAIFFAPFGLRPKGKIQTIGRESDRRHHSVAPRRFTQHDGFYVSENAVVMMEMKLKATTSVEQYVKYCTLATMEELVSGQQKDLGLIYLVPVKAVSKIRKVLRLDDPTGWQKIWSEYSNQNTKAPLRRLFDNHKDKIHDVGSRMRVEILTWDDFLRHLTFAHKDAIVAGNETLENLMAGMIQQIVATPDCGIDPEQAKSWSARGSKNPIQLA